MLSKPLSEIEKVALIRELKSIYATANIQAPAQRHDLKYLLPDGTFLRGGFHLNMLDAEGVKKFLKENPEIDDVGTFEYGKILGHCLAAMLIMPPENGRVFEIAMMCPPNDKQLKALYELGQKLDLKLTTFATENRPKVVLSTRSVASVNELKRICEGLFPEIQKTR